MRWQLPDSGAQLLSGALREQIPFVLLVYYIISENVALSKSRTFCAKTSNTFLEFFSSPKRPNKRETLLQPSTQADVFPPTPHLIPTRLGVPTQSRPLSEHRPSKANLFSFGQG